MESTLQKPALAAKTTPKAKTIVYWIVTALLCLQMSFTAYAQLRLPQVAEAFTHLNLAGRYPFADSPDGVAFVHRPDCSPVAARYNSGRCRK